MISYIRLNGCFEFTGLQYLMRMGLNWSVVACRIECHFKCKVTCSVLYEQPILQPWRFHWTLWKSKPKPKGTKVTRHFLKFTTPRTDFYRNCRKTPYILTFSFWCNWPKWKAYYDSAALWRFFVTVSNGSVKLMQIPNAWRFHSMHCQCLKMHWQRFKMILKWFSTNLGSIDKHCQRFRTQWKCSSTHFQR